MNSEELSAKQKAFFASESTHMALSYKAVMLRIRRATSWIEYAEREINEGRRHTAFIFYWIAFNACYGVSAREDQFQYRQFLSEIIERDKRKLIVRCVLYDVDDYALDIIGNKFAFRLFWEEGILPMQKTQWRNELQREVGFYREQRSNSVETLDLEGVLHNVFDRIYCVRNQVVHGCTTRETSTGETQIDCGSIILDHLVPIFVEVMLDNRHQGPWKHPYFPGEKLTELADGSYAQESGDPWRV